MTLQLILGIDPGQTGAVALLADGEPAGFIDMPTIPRRAGGEQIDAVTLGDSLREELAKHPGASCYAVIEQVSALPKQGSSSGFRFGQSDGIARGVVGALRLPLIEVHPSIWKRHLRLGGKEKDAARAYALQRFPMTAADLRRKKDAARAYALQRFPMTAADLRRKKDIGRADALLIALWAYLTEQVARKAA